MIEQRTEEWHRLRLGKLTASRIADAVATTRTGWGASRANVRAELIVERLTGTPSDNYVNTAMQWGIDHEAEARDAYAFFRDVSVELVAFVDHPRIPWSGCSPDGFVGTDGLVEVKCPHTTATHIDSLLGGSVPDKYRKQVLWQMACTGRKWCDLVSYDPRMPEAMRLHVQRIPRDEAAIHSLERDAELFLREVETCHAALLGQFARAA